MEKQLWENPQVIKINKEDGHVIAMPYDDVESALSGEESKYKQSLNGKWKFYWQLGLNNQPQNFENRVFLRRTCQSVSAALAMLPFHQSRFGQYRDEFLDILLGNLLSFGDLLQGNIRAGVMLRQVRKHSNGVSSTG